MYQSKNTSRFNIHHNVNNIKLYTNSIISIPHYTGHQIKKIQWSRKYNDNSERLPSYDQCQQYECSQFDKDFYIQVLIQTQIGQNLQAKLQTYGPIQLQPQYGFLLEGIRNDWMFDVQIIGNNKIYEVFLTTIENQIILRNKNPQSGYEHKIYLQHILQTSIKKVDNNIQLLVFPSVYLRVVQAKIFKQLVNKYTTNNQPLTLRVVQPNFITNHYSSNKNNDRIKSNMQWRRLLLRLNSIRVENIRRMSSQYVSQPISHNTNRYQDQKKQIQINNSNHITKNRQNQVKKSQNLEQQTLKSSSSKPILQKQKQKQQGGDMGFRMQFQNLLFDKEQQKAEEKLQLQQSFEELQKKSRPQKQKQMRRQIIANKKARVSEDKVKRLKLQLQEILFQRNNLLQNLQIHKAQVQALQNSRMINNANNQATIDSLKNQLNQLRYQYETLLDMTGQRRYSDRKFVS